MPKCAAAGRQQQAVREWYGKAKKSERWAGSALSRLKQVVHCKGLGATAMGVQVSNCLVLLDGGERGRRAVSAAVEGVGTPGYLWKSTGCS